MTQSKDKKQTFWDKMIPWYFVMFFSVIFVVNMVMFYLATTSHTGVVDHQAYQRGLAYNKVIERGDAQRALAWQSDLTIDNDKITVLLTDKDDVAIEQAHVVVYAFRPTQDGYDFKQTMTVDPQTAHMYKADIAFPLKGQWELRFDVERGTDVFYINKKITVE